jgi:SAM-dependent methyltransferase
MEKRLHTGDTLPSAGRTMQDSTGTNQYSDRWFELFLRTIPSAQTAKEVEFLRRQLPNPPFVKLLDVCCGEGRHSIPLTRCGYQVTGIDTNQTALDAARSNAPAGANFVASDMRDLSKLPDTFDAVICMWQSFGYFDESTNRDVLGQMAAVLRPGGRLVLDINHRGFFDKHIGQRTIEKKGIAIAETSSVRAKRQTVLLKDVSTGAEDLFNWQLFTPDELEELANSVGLAMHLACTGFDETLAASQNSPRMQMVFQRFRHSA